MPIVAIAMILLTFSIGQAQAVADNRASGSRVQTAKELMAAIGIAKQLDLILPLLISQMQSAM
ncbi:MAG: hypothetical protein ACR2OX_00640, partial [Methyloligellaceae bacterium]